MKERRAFKIVSTTCAIAALLSLHMMAIPLSVQLTGMSPHIDQLLELRISEISTAIEVDRIKLDRIAEDSFTLDTEALEEGKAYLIDFYVDVSGNGTYDAPPQDYAWRIELGEVVEPVSLAFDYNEMFTDIAWPPQIDGIIGDEEYRNSLTDPATGMVLAWQNDSTYIYVGLIGPGTGWVAVGFDAERKMKGANIIIGAVSDGSLEIEDHFGTTQIGHREDEESDIIQAGGTENDGQTTIEFAVPLESSDKTLAPGQEVNVILAYHSSSDRLNSRHTARSMLQIELDE